MTTNLRPLVALKLPARIKNVITYAQSIATAMTNNTTLPSPTPSLATFQSDINALSAAEAAVLSRAKGAAQARNVKLATVHADLESLKTYVQSVASSVGPEAASAVIASAGMTTRKVTARDKPPLTAKQGSVSGTANLSAKAAGRIAAYSWEYSTDQKTWTSLPMTLEAKTGVSGLTPATT